MPAVRDKALEPFIPSQLVTLSPLQELAAYLIVPAVALLVKTNGRTSGSMSTRASWDDFAISSVWRARPHRPTVFPDRCDRRLSGTSMCLPSRPHRQLSFAIVYSLLSFH